MPRRRRSIRDREWHRRPHRRGRCALPVRVADYTAWSMEPHDLVLRKLGAGREKDLEFARDAALVVSSLVREAVLSRDELSESLTL